MGDTVKFCLENDMHRVISIFVPTFCKWELLVDLVCYRFEVKKEDISYITLRSDDIKTWCTFSSDVMFDTSLCPNLYSMKCVVHLKGMSEMSMTSCPDKLTDFTSKCEITHVSNKIYSVDKELRLQLFESSSFNEKYTCKPYSLDFISSKDDNSILESRNITIEERNMIIACKNGLLSVAKSLYLKGITNLNACDDATHNSCLHHALMNGHPRVAKWIIENGGSLTSWNHRGLTPIHIMCALGMLEFLPLIPPNHVNIHSSSNHATPLHYACYYNQVEIVRYMVQSLRANVNSLDIMDYSPLHVACELGHLSVVKCLMTTPLVNLNTELVTKLGDTALQTACVFNQYEIVKYLITYHKVNIATLNHALDNLLHSACSFSTAIADCAQTDSTTTSNELKDINESKIEKETIINPNDDVVVQSSMMLVKYLVGRGVLSHAQNVHGDVPHESARRQSNHEIADFLEDLNSNNESFRLSAQTFCSDKYYNVIDYKSFRHALYQGERNVSLLDDKIIVLSKGTDIDKGKHDIDTSLSKADQDNEVTVISRDTAISIVPLLKSLLVFNIHHSFGAGADVLYNPNDNDDSGKSQGKKADDAKVNDIYTLGFLDVCRDGPLEELLQYIQLGANLNVMSKNGLKGVHLAAASGQLDILKQLVRNGCDINSLSLTGGTPLHYACQSSELEVVMWLVRQEAISVNIQANNGLLPIQILCFFDSSYFFQEICAMKSEFDLQCTLDGGSVGAPNDISLMHLACAHQLSNLVHILLELEASISKIDSKKCTCLHYAVLSGDIRTVKALVRSTSNLASIVNEQDCMGKTPIYHACCHGFLLIAQFLVNYGASDSICDHLGNNCLHVSCQNGYVELAVWLFERNHALSTASNHEGLTPRDYVHLPTFRANCLNFKYLIDTIKAELQEGNLSYIKDVLMDPSDMCTIILSENGLGTTSLHVAASEGHLEMVKYFESIGVPLAFIDSYGNTALHYSSMNGHADLTRFLLREGCLCKEQNNRDLTAMDLAVINGHIDVVDMIYAYDKDALNIQGKKTKCTPLHLACHSQDIDVVLHILKYSTCNKNLQDADGNTPLMLACQVNNLQMVQALVPFENVIDISNNANMTPFLVACCNGDVDIASLLRDFGANILCTGGGDSIANTALHFAGSNGRLDMCKWLIDCGLDNNRRNRNENLAMELALLNGHKAVCEWLSIYGSSYFVDRFSESIAPNMNWALKHFYFNYAKSLIDDYMDNLPDFFYVDLDGLTPLHIACGCGNIQYMQDMIRHEVDVNCVCKEDLTPFLYSCLKGQLACLKSLVQYPINVLDVDFRGDTALHIAVTMNYVEITEWLLELDEFKQYPDIQNLTGWSALHYACDAGNFDMVKILIRAKLSSNTLSYKYDVTPFHLACILGHESIVNLLVEESDADILILNAEGCSSSELARLEGFTSVADYLDDLIVAKPSDNVVSTEIQKKIRVDEKKLKKYFNNINKIDTDNISKSVVSDMSAFYLSACQNNMFSDVAIALQVGVNVNSVNPKTYMTGLHYATWNNNLNMMELLIKEYGAELNHVNAGGLTPLHISCDQQYVDAAIYLIQCGASLVICNNLGDNPIHVIASRKLSTVASAVIERINFTSSHLEDFRAHAAKANNNGKYPIHVAVLSGSAVMVGQIAEITGHLYTQDDDGRSALILACSAGSLETAFVLLKLGADLNSQDNEGRTALHYVCESGNFPVFSWLLDCGANLNILSYSGDSVLHVACHNGRLLIAKHLVQQNGLLLDVPNQSNMTARHLALQSSNKALINFVNNQPFI